jgi:SAM-dependent methyltransferase
MTINKQKLPFELPAPQGQLSAPVWSGDGFRLNGKHIPVLEYSENFEGCSDSLTELHDEIDEYHPISLASRNYVVMNIKKYLTVENPVILEIGCSSGNMLKKLADEFPDAVLCGADVVKKPLYKLAKKCSGIQLFRFDLLQCPLQDEIVDVLIMLNVLEHINDDQTALQKAYNLLKPGGLLIIEVPAGPVLYDSYDAELLHFRRYSRKDLTGKICLAGFRIIRNSHLGLLIFPAFAVVKLFNRLFKSNRTKTVRKYANITSNNNLLKAIFGFEYQFFSRFSLPYGIRCLAVAKKP